MSDDVETDLLMDCEKFNYFPALEQVRCLLRALQTSTIKFFAKIASSEGKLSKRINLISICIVTIYILVFRSLGVN